MTLLEEVGIQPLYFCMVQCFLRAWLHATELHPLLPSSSPHPPGLIALFHLDSLPFSRRFLQVFHHHPWDITGLLELHGNCWWGWTFTLHVGKTGLGEDTGLGVVGVHGPQRAPRWDAPGKPDMAQLFHSSGDISSQASGPGQHPACSCGRESPETHPSTRPANLRTEGNPQAKKHLENVQLRFNPSFPRHECFHFKAPLVLQGKRPGKGDRGRSGLPDLGPDAEESPSPLCFALACLDTHAAGTMHGAEVRNLGGAGCQNQVPIQPSHPLPCGALQSQGLGGTGDGTWRSWDGCDAERNPHPVSLRCLKRYLGVMGTFIVSNPFICTARLKRAINAVMLRSLVAQLCLGQGWGGGLWLAAVAWRWPGWGTELPGAASLPRAGSLQMWELLGGWGLP